MDNNRDKINGPNNGAQIRICQAVISNYNFRFDTNFKKHNVMTLFSCLCYSERFLKNRTYRQSTYFCLQDISDCCKQIIAGCAGINLNLQVT